MSGQSHDLQLGQIIRDPDAHPKRDATHVAVVQMTAKQGMLPGDPVNKKGQLVEFAKAVGIVDPFLSADVVAGDIFWCFLFPGSITSLAHSWTHPAFDKAKSEVAPSLSDQTVESIQSFAIGNAIVSIPTLGESNVNADDDALSRSYSSFRSATVMDLCKQIREIHTNDQLTLTEIGSYRHLLPILGDALQDAGCDNHELILLCYKEHPWNFRDIAMFRILAIVENDESAAAVKAIDDIAAALYMSYFELMDAAGDWLRNGETKTQYGDEWWRDTFPEMSDDFWRQYAIVMGVEAESNSAHRSSGVHVRR